jgi:serine phosphatase RsbU (regulator of sigma subunit)
LFTDGYADQFGGPKGKKFKYKQLSDLLVSIYKKPINEQYYLLNRAFENWMGTHEQVDDVCIIGIRI